MSVLFIDVIDVSVLFIDVIDVSVLFIDVIDVSVLFIDVIDVSVLFIDIIDVSVLFIDIINVSVLFIDIINVSVLFIDIINVYVLFIGIIDVAAEWASDLKEGVCPSNPYYDRDSCCWLSNQTFEDGGSCGAWEGWGLHTGVHSNGGRYALEYFIYVSFAVVFASLSGLFVVVLAPYAAGSGIPEVHIIHACTCMCYN